MQLYRQADTDGQDARLLSPAARWLIRRVLVACSIPGPPLARYLRYRAGGGFAGFLLDFSWQNFCG